MSSAAEMFIHEEVQEAIRAKYPELAEAGVDVPGWAYDVWDQSLLPEKFTVEVTDSEWAPLATVEVLVGFDIEGDDSGRWISAHVKEVTIVGKAT